ncbi:phospholipase D-like domain-containing protein [Actinoallomurus rhizosphaericola]|uniref:phospholipase D-like domain-containing protein n=1 Tax=Actinoallomurus rhizosphaericola TaxID=2952536 RepID=UPI002091FC35|nr:phospholipase D-like domain-containing protein [Actinoallomurus rhizosphaericola]MCO5999466.1 phospholipase D-like domain-containing protein [Actinoallomurus rhizosphaericola]
MRWTARIAVLAVCGLAAGTLPPATAALAAADLPPAADPGPVAGRPGGDGTGSSAVRSIFNAPQAGSARRDAIADQVARLIAGTPAGQTIAVAMYHFSSLDTARQLIAANRRRVRVQVVLDHESTAYPAYKKLRAGLGANTRKPSWVVTCGRDRGCIGPSFNHNKFFLFSSALGAKDVVLQTSANATDGARDTQWNDALTIQDAGVHAAYLRYFQDLAAQHRTGDYHRSVRSGPYRIDFFPWAKGDPISDALDKVSCAGGTRLRLSVGHFTWAPIAKRLWKLDDEGCRVQVVFDQIGQRVARRLTKPGGRHGNPEIRYLSENGHVYAHSKYLLIDGGYQVSRQKVVSTGSPNYTEVGFHSHDEAMITMADAALEDGYAANFDAVFAHAHAVKATDVNSVPAAVYDLGGDSGSGSE